MTFAEAFRQAEEDLIVEACRRHGLDVQETACCVAYHRSFPWMLGLVQVHGGDVSTFVRDWWQVLTAGARH